MRYNTELKRLKIRQEMIDYLIEYPGYTLKGATDLTDHWIKYGMAGTLNVYHEDINWGKLQINYNKKYKIK